MVQQIDAERTREMMKDEGVILIDVLGAESYRQQHLPGAVNIPVSHPDFQREMQERIPSTDSKVIVYCASLQCQASPKAAARLEDMGYDQVYDFEAGLQGWEEAGFAFEGEAASGSAKEQTGDRKEQAQRHDAARDKGGRAASRQEAQDRKGQEKEIRQRGDTPTKTKDTGEKVDIEDMETHMQAG